MVIVRPASREDLEPLLALAGRAGVGLTTLPPDRDLLERRILKSQRSFERIPDRPGGESYLLVMLDAASGHVVGASGIVSKVGGYEPFYAYQVEQEVHACDFLNVRTEVAFLQPVREHDGPAEIGSLFLDPDYRGRDNGRLLQLVRFLFLAEHRQAFETQVVSELRGVIDPAGHSPFWDAVGRHFFDIDFPRADHLSVVNKRFIAELMPTHPIYVPLLPQSAREVIGRPHDDTRPAMRNLEAEGFRFCGMIDIFDAGPCVCCPRDEIRTVRESRVARVTDVTSREQTSPTYIMCASGSEDGDFRACMGSVLATPDGVSLSAECAGALRVRAGDLIRFATLRPTASVVSESQRRPAVAERLTEGAD